MTRNSRARLWGGEDVRFQGEIDTSAIVETATGRTVTLPVDAPAAVWLSTDPPPNALLTIDGASGRWSGRMTQVLVEEAPDGCVAREDLRVISEWRERR